MTRNRLIMSIIFCFLLTGALAERTYKSSGDGYQVVLSEEREELADGSTLETGRSKSLWTATTFDPNSPLPKNGTCSSQSSVIWSPGGEGWVGAGLNHCTDKDGDSWWEAWEGNQDSGTFIQIRGTGKYLGISGNGTWKAGTQYNSGTSTHTWSLTQTLP